LRTGFGNHDGKILDAMLFRWDKALAAADAIEDKERVRKLALRK